MSIQQLKNQLQKELEKKQECITEITNFVKLYGRKIVFDDIQSEEPNVCLPIDYMFSDPVMVGVDSVRYDKKTNKVLMDCGWYDGEDACEMDIPIDELSVDALYELVWWLDLYDKEQNDKQMQHFHNQFVNAKENAAYKNTPFSNYLCNQMDVNDFIFFTFILGAETTDEKNKAIKIASPRALFAWTLFELED